MANPKNNLPPEAQPWARFVEERLAVLDRLTAQSSVTDTAQNRTLQIAQQGLNTLTAVTDSLTANTQVLNTLVSQVTQVTRAQSTTTNFSITQASKTHLTTNIPIPTGAKFAIVFVGIDWTLQSSMAAGSSPWINIRSAMSMDNLSTSDSPGWVEGPPIIPPPNTNWFWGGGSLLSGTFTNVNEYSQINLTLNTLSSGYTVAAHANNQFIMNSTALFLAR